MWRQVDPPEDIEVPQSLLPDEEVERLVAERQPRFVPLERFGPGSDPLPPPDPASGAPQSAPPFFSVPVPVPCLSGACGARSDVLQCRVFHAVRRHVEEGSVPFPGFVLLDAWLRAARRAFTPLLLVDRPARYKNPPLNPEEPYIKPVHMRAQATCSGGWATASA